MKPHIQRVIEGLDIIAKYDPNAEVVCYGEMIYIRGDYPDELPSRDRQMLDELDWFLYDFDKDLTVDSGYGSAWATICT